MLEFLTPERGAGRSAPVPIPRLGMNAVALRFLNFLTDDVVHATAGDLRIALPHPVPFALHKLIVSQRRRKKDKGVKDYQMAVELLRALIQKGDGHKIRNTFDNIPRSWRTKILSGLNPRADHDIRAVLTP